MEKIRSELQQGEAGQDELRLFEVLMSGVQKLFTLKKAKYNRVLPVGEYLIDRDEKARLLGFGEGTTIYDSSVVLGNVEVGANTWIGPNVLLDGSDKLTIGNNCSISAGVQVYTHDSVQWAVSGGEKEYEYGPTVIEDNCYIGPNSIVQKGVTIGRGTIVGANSLVTKSIPPNSKAYGSPAKIFNQGGG